MSERSLDDKPKRPICSNCEREMKPIFFTHYYSNEPGLFWECYCTEETFKALNAERVHEGY
jgi:hypothetical protein